MKVIQINATCSAGSTGKICEALSRGMTERGIENRVLYFIGHSDYPLAVKCSDRRYIHRQAFLTRLCGDEGFRSRKATERVIRELEQFSPDIVFLHNIHGHCCDLEMLFSYLKQHSMKLLWTFHDCWAFTGYCMYFDMVGCSAWQTGCGRCPVRKKYSWFFDRSSELCRRKRVLFTDLDLTILTPSRWLADLVKQSFLKEYPVYTVHNGINLDVFRPIRTDFRERYGIPQDRFILLGVSFEWERRKGLDVWLELAAVLDKERYQVVLVGTDDDVDRRLPEHIISIHRTQNAKELAEIYSAADVFVNPTREENYPTVNLEAIACGTPVVTFETGGSAEMLDASCGVSVPTGDTDALLREISAVCEEHRFSADDCRRRAESAFSEKMCYEKVFDLLGTL